MRIAIVDDDPCDRESLLSYLQEFFAEEDEICETQLFENPADFLDHYMFSFDFIILDIDMPGINGMDAARALRKKDPRVAIMFVTNMPQYAIDGYEVDAVDYVLKPLTRPAFRLKMEKAVRYVRRNADGPIVLKTADGAVQRRISEILYVESRLNYLYYHIRTEAGTETVRVRGKLSDVQPGLLPYHFAYSSKSYLVNLELLSAIEGNEIIVDGERLPISRRHKAEFLSAFTKYMGGM